MDLRHLAFATLKPILAVILLFLSGCSAQSTTAQQITAPPIVLGPFNYSPTVRSELTQYTVSRPATQKKLAAVLLIHGGGWSGGEPEQMQRYVAHVLDSGWVAINAGYRLTPEAKWPAQRDDLHALMADISERAKEIGVDPERIAILGYSAGAHLGLVAATQANLAVPRPAALVLGAGPYDLRRYPNSTLVKDLLGGNPATVGSEIFADASPLLHVDKQTPPTYLWHGSWDLTVGIDQSRALAEALENADVPVELKERFAYGHIGNFFLGKKSWQSIDAFLRQWLEPNPQL
ncbi:alpha/beta hydrolase [Spongiibacter sp. KMU-158]|uniref:Alpha/beta hydrolase n=1 Tax=Spongiibacter pelagi TaxID=2760804 RepID=A0A927C4Z7_9GAMM|nr:alpha/beta hydrolase [Spongiibacter pelagi]MBD2859525.1 alpha/beta hydrolase [Spongiibacter pelagi]